MAITTPKDNPSGYKPPRIEPLPNVVEMEYHEDYFISEASLPVIPGPSLDQLPTPSLAPDYGLTPWIEAATEKSGGSWISGMLKTVGGVFGRHPMISLLVLEGIAIATFLAIQTLRSTAPSASPDHTATTVSAIFDKKTQLADQQARAYQAAGVSNETVDFAKNAYLLTEGVQLAAKITPPAISPQSEKSQPFMVVGSRGPYSYSSLKNLDVQRQVRSLLKGISQDSLMENSASLHGATLIPTQGDVR